MTPERWRRAKTIFAALVDLDPEHQQRLLADLCSSENPELLIEIRELLTAHRERGFVDELAARLGAPPSPEPMDALLPQRIGRYDIIEQIGEGGMGVVFKARDAQLDRFVAVKLISPARNAFSLEVKIRPSKTSTPTGASTQAMRPRRSWTS